jgi:hypothetical protein
MCTPPFCKSSLNHPQKHPPLPLSSMTQTSLLEMLASLAVGDNQHPSTDSSCPMQPVNIAPCETLLQDDVCQTSKEIDSLPSASAPIKHDSRNEGLAHFVNIPELLHLCSLFDGLTPFEVRRRIWNDFARQLQTPLPQNPLVTGTGIYFTPLVQKWLQSTENHQDLLSAFHKTLLQQQSTLMNAVKFPNSLFDTRRYSASNINGLKQNNIVIPIPNRVVLSHSDTHNEQQQQQQPSSLIPSPELSPWGWNYLANLEKLVCLQFWAPTLDKLAPSDKSIIWAVCKLLPNEFGNNYDPTGFRKTIAKWTNDPIHNIRAINILFSAIGYLKYYGVLKHEFFYPKTLVPVFHLAEELCNKKKRRRRRKKSTNPPPVVSPSPNDSSEAVQSPLYLLSFLKRPNPPAKLYISQASAFAPPTISLDKNRLFSRPSPISSETLSPSGGHKRTFNEVYTTSDTFEGCSRFRYHRPCTVASHDFTLTSTPSTASSVSSSGILKSAAEVNLPVEDGTWQQPQKRRKLDTSGHTIQKISLVMKSEVGSDEQHRIPQPDLRHQTDDDDDDDDDGDGNDNGNGNNIQAPAEVQPIVGHPVNNSVINNNDNHSAGNNNTNNNNNNAMRLSHILCY